MSQATRADGSSAQDARAPVRLDLSKTPVRLRYTCPNGHSAGSWSRTNNHLYCSSCLRQMENGSDVTPEHYHLVDQKTGEEIPWSRVQFGKVEA